MFHFLLSLQTHKVLHRNGHRNEKSNLNEKSKLEFVVLRWIFEWRLESWMDSEVVIEPWDENWLLSKNWKRSSRIGDENWVPWLKVKVRWAKPLRFESVFVDNTGAWHRGYIWKDAQQEINTWVWLCLNKAYTAYYSLDISLFAVTSKLEIKPRKSHCAFWAEILGKTSISVPRPPSLARNSLGTDFSSLVGVPRLV